MKILKIIRYICTHVIIAANIPKIAIFPKNIVDNKGMHSVCFKKHPSKLK